jgi:hypothetical protein
MEELHEELQRCYGSVRYRRSIERSVVEAPPVPQRRNSAQVSGTIHTPTGTPQLRNDGASPGAAGSAPILLTRKKERRRTTLPMELAGGPDPAEDQKTPPPVTNEAAVAVPVAVNGDHDEWAEPARPEVEDAWAELDLDAME